MTYNYPLQVDPFSIWDRLKAAWFIIKGSRLTMGAKVKEFEDKWRDLGNSKYAVMTSSGSTANDLLFEVAIQTHSLSPSETTVFVPSTTWASSISPVIMKGFNIEFVDINLNDFSFDYQILERELAKSNSKNKIIWTTALIGHIPNVTKLKELSNKYGCFLFCDACEATIGWDTRTGENILSSFDMVTTSTYWAHEFSSIEGGLLFTNNEEYHRNALLIRNHGLARSLPKDDKVRLEVERKHSKIDKEFLFQKIGTNLRSTDLNAYFGLLDTKRYYKYCRHRRKIWNYFLGGLSKEFIYLNSSIVPFCLPLIFKEDQNEKRIKELKAKLNKAGWETRPVIAFLPEHPAYKEFAKGKVFPNSEFLARNGCYVGLSNNLTKKDVDKLIGLL